MEHDSTYGQVICLPKGGLHGAAGNRGPVIPTPVVGSDVLQEALPGRGLDPAATALILATLQNATSPVLWAQDRSSRRENGHLYTPGLKSIGIAAPILHVRVNHPRDVLLAMEEGAACRGLSAVVGEIHGGPSVLDFTATKRLVLRAERSGVPLWLIRSGETGTLSAARSRWRVRSRPSDLHPYDPRAPGDPVWDADLFRARHRPPGRWDVRHDSAHGLHLVARSGDREMAADRPANTHLAR